MSATMVAAAVVFLLGVVVIVIRALQTKGDVKTSFKVPFLASFSLEAKDRRPPQPSQRLKP